MTTWFKVAVDPDGDYRLYGDDGDLRSSGTLLDEPSLAIDLTAAAWPIDNTVRS